MYCTLDDLLKQVPEAVLISLTDDEGTGAINQAVVDQAIQAAQDEADTYIGTRYPLPLSHVPGIVKKLTADIALYNLFARRGFDSGENSADNVIVRKYDGAIKLLSSIAKGAVGLGTSEPPPPSSGAQITSSIRVFSRDKMEGF